MKNNNFSFKYYTKSYIGYSEKKLSITYYCFATAKNNRDNIYCQSFTLFHSYKGDFRHTYSDEDKRRKKELTKIMRLRLTGV
jgi:hypothetical protein